MVDLGKPVKVRQRKPAVLRTCASCEWIFKGGVECPRCAFGSYGAKRVYGTKAYKYAKTQQPWLDKKLFEYETKLRNEIKNLPIEENKSWLQQ